MGDLEGLVATSRSIVALEPTLKHLLTLQQNLANTGRYDEAVGLMNHMRRSWLELDTSHHGGDR